MDTLVDNRHNPSTDILKSEEASHGENLELKEIMSTPMNASILVGPKLLIASNEITIKDTSVENHDISPMK